MRQLHTTRPKVKSSSIRMTPPSTAMVVGSVVVTTRRRLVINGSVIGTVTVQPGAHVDLHGVLIGSITSHGGKVNVTGVLEGAMSGESFEVCAGAVVHDVTQAIDRGIH